MAQSIAFAIAFGPGPLVVADEAKIDRGESLPTDTSLVRADNGRESPGRREGRIIVRPTAEVEAPGKLPGKAGIFEKTGATDFDGPMVLNGGNSLVKSTSDYQTSFDPDGKGPMKERTGHDLSNVQLAQFQLPKPAAEGESPVDQLPKDLAYEYGFGSESETVYRNNSNLNSRVEDDFLIVVPELNGYVTYRPADWMEATLEMILEWEMAVMEEDVIVLPDGEIQFSESRQVSLLVDQAYVTFKRFLDPFNVTLGRRNFEDDRHWLYDTSMDVALVTLRGKFRAEASIGREVLLDLDGIKRQAPDQINTGIIYGEYRGIENIKLAGYAVYRDDRDDREGQEGRPLLMGLRSLGSPTERFSYWADFAFLRGADESGRDFSSAYGFDVGGTYRFLGVPLNPNITLGFAFGTGDRNPDDNANNAFRQTGLQSNETRFGGIPEFKIYGEALDPELSNLKIFTLGVGVRPVPDVSFDLVYHYYRLDEIAEEIRNSPITAQMNQIDSQLSKEVGSGLDLVVGFRNVFGVRRLGVDLRAGWLFPGKAFRTEEGDGGFREADTGVSMVFKFWW